ncbi:MAG TPA: His/Gly/Thr/Pro-type tRNA ligase C-terminal domain-containing protein, partial [Acidimicrobiales bacterium]|nr:His/Gly/Thr/Pro-type tRNA ligase C-terminal domain-containing protein [Acidimicrobiales bacterium]
FAKAFDIQFSSETGSREYAWQTSWGSSTRLVGALIMAHGDDAGLRLPPALAPVEVVVVVVRESDATNAAAADLVSSLRAAGRRVRLDDRVAVSFGRRAVEWELKGVPVRIEVGPRDLANGEVTVVRRDNLSKSSVAVDSAVGVALEFLDAIQAELLESARSSRDSRTVSVSSVADVAPAVGDGGFALVPWSEVGVEGEARLAGDGLSVRCLRRPDGSLASSDDEADLVAVVAKSY